MPCKDSIVINDMKKQIINKLRFYIATSILLALAAGCSKEGQNKDKEPSAIEGEELHEASKGDGEMSDRLSFSADNMESNGHEDGAEGEHPEEAKSGSRIPERDDSELPEKDEPETVLMINPSWDYYNKLLADTNAAAETGTIANAETEAKAETETEAAAESKADPLELILLEQHRNQITDEEAWFKNNQLTLPELNDEGYQCDIYGMGTFVDIFKDGEIVATLDFSEFKYADDFKPEDRDYVEQEIHSAAVHNGILYVSSFHYTYAASSPHTGYIMAISLSDYSVLWKTEALVCNSLNFEIVGDVILCGYGFTAEDDYLYQLDIRTGQVINQIWLASMADYIICKDDKLFVRTYHTDYVFQIE